MLGINKTPDLCACSLITIFDNFFTFHTLLSRDFEVKGMLRNLLHKSLRISAFSDWEWMFSFWQTLSIIIIKILKSLQWSKNVTWWNLVSRTPHFSKKWISREILFWFTASPSIKNAVYAHQVDNYTNMINEQVTIKCSS